MKLALGTVQFGLEYGIANERGQIPVDEARAILRHAESSGIDTLDTAAAYGGSEQRLGEIGVARWRVVSKLPPVPQGCHDISEWVSSSVQESLARLRCATLHGLLLHRADDLRGPGAARLYGALKGIKERGLARKIGVSVYDPSELDALCPLYEFDLIQAPFSLVDRRLSDSGWLTRLYAMNIELHVRSVFLQGLLLMSSERRPATFSRWAPLWDEFEGWMRETGLTPLQACLRSVLSVAEISKVIVGVDRLGHLRQVLEAADGPAPRIPAGLQTSDPDLLNPSRWGALS